MIGIYMSRLSAMKNHGVVRRWRIRVRGGGESEAGGNKRPVIH
jgi:hypothetical protein